MSLVAASGPVWAEWSAKSAEVPECPLVAASGPVFSLGSRGLRRESTGVEVPKVQSRSAHARWSPLPALCAAKDSGPSGVPARLAGSMPDRLCAVHRTPAHIRSRHQTPQPASLAL